MSENNNKKKSEDSVELSVDELEEASGGYVLDTKARDGFRYVVVDDRMGKKITTPLHDLNQAKGIARHSHVSDEVITKAQYNELFG